MLDKYNIDNEGSTLNIIIDSIVVGILLVFIIVMILSSKSDNYITNTEPTIKTVTISDLYKSNNTYYVEVVDVSNHLYYDIKINKSDFIRYKIDDVISIKIDGNKAYIHHTN